MKRNRVFAYTDGSSQENPGIGGMAFVITNWDKSKIITKQRKFLDITTNNQAELLATIEATEWFLENCNTSDYLVLMTDSRYCSSGFNDLMDKWAANNWKDSKMKNRLNVAMWKRLYNLKLKGKGRIHFHWIKGHSGDEFNEMADIMSYEVWQRWLRKNKT